MHCKLIMWANCLLLVFLSGCVSKIEFDAVTNEYRLARKEMSGNEEKIKNFEQKLQEMKEEKAKLDNQMKTLRKTIREKEIVISLQGKIIKLLDDSNQTLQKSIEAQIADQNIKIDAFPSSP